MIPRIDIRPGGEFHRIQWEVAATSPPTYTPSEDAEPGAGPVPLTLDELRATAEAINEYLEEHDD